MTSLSDHSVPADPKPAGEDRRGVVRLLVLGGVYAVAVAFAIAGSPSVGLTPLNHQVTAPQHTAFLASWTGSGLRHQ